jgi:radical SAM protein with 4Fe4S-binding SPASM domain
LKFYRIYIELTNICGLKCSFCPTKDLPIETIDLELFKKIIKEARVFTKEIACHVVGDPLTLSNLANYLDIINRYGMRAIITTSGYYIKNHDYKTLFHPAIKQINISLNSFNKNDKSITFDSYIEPILDLCQEKVVKNRDIFINLRMWNLDEVMSEERFNQIVFKKLNSFFKTDLKLKELNPKERKNIRLDNKILLHFDNYFEWPSLNNPIYGHGTCQGLNSHIAILASGKVIPCCLDSNGVIILGDLNENSLKEILNQKRAKDIRDGFRDNVCSEELCLKCSYKDRFN